VRRWCGGKVVRREDCAEGRRCIRRMVADVSHIGDTCASRLATILVKVAVYASRSWSGLTGVSCGKGMISYMRRQGD
jgi:hypothetical protein